MLKQGQWSIGIYTGDSPVCLKPPEGERNPVLTAGDVTDAQAEFVADPFMVKEGSTWYLFCEVMKAKTGKAAIGLATSEDGFHWAYRQIVLEEPFHLSYPYVFKWEGAYYMLPESRQAHAIRLYRAVRFPMQWSCIGTLLEGNFEDSSVIYRDGVWWLFSKTNPNGNDTLSLYFSEDLRGPWHEHPKSPIVRGDRRKARPGGRLVDFDGRIVRFAQECQGVYGKALWAFEITKLTKTDYEERDLSTLPILEGTGAGWNGQRMHHADPHPFGLNQWIACVDGYGEEA